MKLFLTSVLAMALTVSCVTLSKDAKEEAPVLHGDQPTEEIIGAAIEFGGETLKSAKKILIKKKKLKEASMLLRIQIADQFQSWDTKELINAINLYQSTDAEKSEQLFTLLVRSDRKLARQLSWYIAGTFASKKMAAAIDNFLSDELKEEDFAAVLVPQMATAVAANNLRSSYSFMKYGLFRTNNDEFARAMIRLEPKKASSDFMIYLSQAPIKELRQLTMNTLSVFSCTVALNHILSVPVSVSHPNFNHLFLYSVSRNNALSDTARKILVSYLPKESKAIALKLSILPNWVQIAFVEGSRKKMVPVLGMMLSDLKEISSEKDVIEEINSVRL